MPGGRHTWREERGRERGRATSNKVSPRENPQNPQPVVSMLSSLFTVLVLVLPPPLSSFFFPPTAFCFLSSHLLSLLLIERLLRAMWNTNTFLFQAVQWSRNYLTKGKGLGSIPGCDGFSKPQGTCYFPIFLRRGSTSHHKTGYGGFLTTGWSFPHFPSRVTRVKRRAQQWHDPRSNLPSRLTRR